MHNKIHKQDIKNVSVSWPRIFLNFQMKKIGGGICNIFHICHAFNMLIEEFERCRHTSRKELHAFSRLGFYMSVEIRRFSKTADRVEIVSFSVKKICKLKCFYR